MKQERLCEILENEGLEGETIKLTRDVYKTNEGIVACEGWTSQEAKIQT